MVNVHRTGERKKNLLFLFFANAGLSPTRSGISLIWYQPASRLLTPSPVAQPGLCLHGFFLKQWGVWAEITQNRSRQESSWEKDPTVTNLAQCPFLKGQHQGQWFWRPALIQLYLSHLDEDADPHTSPKIHVIVCNQHWTFKAQAKLPALTLLPCASYFICLFPSSLSPATIPKISWT